MKLPRKFSWIKTGKEKFPGGEWFVEWFSEGEFHAHKIEKMLACSSTEFQNAALFETPTFKKCLVIDSETQSTQYDEYIYHESLTVPALVTHENPRTALILGGGEGATARDILSCKSIEKLVMVDIDYHILEFAEKHMRTWHKNSFRDERMRLLVQDARKYVRKTKLKFDIIYSDLPSPIEGGPAYQMYTEEFYRILKRRLNKGGIFAAQTGPGTLVQFSLHPIITNTLKKVFRHVKSYISFIPGYDMPWAFSICSDSPISPENADEREMNARIKKRFSRELRFIDAKTIRGIFNLPKIHREIISKEKKVIRMDKPVFFTTSYGGEK